MGKVFLVSFTCTRSAWQINWLHMLLANMVDVYRSCYKSVGQGDTTDLWGPFVVEQLVENNAIAKFQIE